MTTQTTQTDHIINYKRYEYLLAITDNFLNQLGANPSHFHDRSYGWDYILYTYTNNDITRNVYVYVDPLNFVVDKIGIQKTFDSPVQDINLRQYPNTDLQTLLDKIHDDK